MVLVVKISHTRKVYKFYKVIQFLFFSVNKNVKLKIKLIKHKKYWKFVINLIQSIPFKKQSIFFIKQTSFFL